MNIKEDNKQMIIAYIVECVTENPEWFGDIVMAMQQGLTNALMKERHDASDLAVGLLTFICWENNKKKFPFYHTIQNSLKALYQWYGTALVWSKVKPLIEGDENELD